MRKAKPKVTYLVLLDIGAIEDHMARDAGRREAKTGIDAPGMTRAPSFAVPDGQGGIAR
ncbi:MAG: hypothetical protein WAM30_19205 [Candidatus Dormiibacterota bacterium]